MTLNKTKISSFLVALFSIVAVLVQIVELEDDTMNLYKGLCGLICFVYALFVVNRKTLNMAIIVGVVSTILMFVSFIYNANIRPNNFAWIWSYMGVAMLLYEFGANKKMSLFIFYGFAVFFIYLAVVNGIDSRGALQQNSANYISVFLIFCLCVYYISIRNARIREFSYIPLLVILFISLWAGNRSGVICMGIVIPIIIVLNRRISNRTKHRFRFIFMLLLTIVAIVFLSNYVIDYFEAFTRKTETSGMASQRTIIWKEYIDASFENVGNFIFGVPAKLPVYRLLSHYKGNPHNTFLMLHSKFGIVGLMFVVLFIFKALWKYIKYKEYYMLIIVLMVVIRSFFDWTAFPGLYDVIFYYMFFHEIGGRSKYVNSIRFQEIEKSNNNYR